MLEFILVLPLIALILGLTMFFGWALVNQQEVKASNRYAAWREVETRVNVSGADLNALFFQQKASSVGLTEGGGPTDVLQKLVSEVGQGSSTGAQDFAHTMVLDHYPHGQSADVSAQFPTSVALWNNLGLTGAIKAGHVRDGSQWPKKEVTQPWAILRDQFYKSQDSVFQSVPAPGNLWGSTMRTLYLAGW
jgi:hypothetical protein